jgi:hypothetical protein
MSALVGKYLYHGSINKLSTGFPTKKNGNWFSTDPLQSILHSLSLSAKDEYKVPYLYIYKVAKEPNIIKFNTPNNFNSYATSMGAQLGKSNETFAFSNANYNIAKKLCENGTYNGWWFPADQEQVMLCDPPKFLRFIKVLRIKKPEKGWYSTVFSKGIWTKENNKFTTVAVTLNNIINRNQPSPKLLYYVKNNEGTHRYYNVNGDPIKIKSVKTSNGTVFAFDLKGKTYKLANIHYGNIPNDNKGIKRAIMANRLKVDKTKKRNIGSASFTNFENKTNYKAMKKEVINKWRAKRFARKINLINNNTINISNLYK